MPPHTNILPELARRQPRLEHFIDFLERPVLDLREVEVHPYDGEEAGWAPDPACEVLVWGVGEGGGRGWDVPYSGPQLSESGLMKYGAVKVASHAPAKPTAAATPKV